jgi:hypothetical protein
MDLVTIGSVRSTFVITDLTRWDHCGGLAFRNRRTLCWSIHALPSSGRVPAGAESTVLAQCQKNIRSSELAFAAPGLCPPQVLRQNRFDYDNGAVATGQAESVAAAVVARTTASSYEQKDRTPVWPGAVGFPKTL